LIILLGLLAANLPFFNQRVFAVLPLRTVGAHTAQATGKKPFWMRLVELLALYALVGLLAHFWEASLGNVFHQGWEFYALTVCIFLVLAFPGFVFQSLLKRR
jgi:hypothetical protein